MDIYAWGFNGFNQFSMDGSNKTNQDDDILTPSKRASAPEADVLWVSWCDAVECDDFLHTGYSISSEHQQNISSKLNSDSGPPESCFGTHDGLKGITGPHGFFFLLEEANYTLGSDIDSRINHIAIAGNGSIVTCSPPEALITMMNKTENPKDEVKAFKDWDCFKTHYCEKKVPNKRKTVPSRHGVDRDLGRFHVKQLVANATSFTLLDAEGKVYTMGDRRYARCLGRRSHDWEHGSLEVIPYLEETKVIKITSGGWMSAAISEDGELFVWGQSEPGIDHEISALKYHDPDSDEYIHVVDVSIDDKEAMVKDVAIGSGHIIIAAEVVERGKVVDRAVFACGQGESGQLGIGGRLEFVENLVEAEELRGREIVKLVAGGRSSFAVVRSRGRL